MKEERVEAKYTCKRCGKEFVITLPAWIVPAMGAMVGTCPPCKVDSTDPLVVASRELGISPVSDNVKADA
jgi:hypothetical protein